MVWCLRVTHIGRLVQGCHLPGCPSVPREDTVVQPCGTVLRGVPRGTAPVRPRPGDGGEADGRSEVRKRFAYASGRQKP